MESVDTAQRIEWGVAHEVSPGQERSGDVHAVLTHRRGTLIAVIDGCGHGPEAAEVAERAIKVLREEPDNSVLSHFERCHRALQQTRGVVMTLADFDARERTLTLCGVGNVEANLLRFRPREGAPPRETALLRGGLLGSDLPPAHASVVPVQGGDVLVLMTDGVKPDLPADLPLRAPPQRLAEQLLERQYKGNDDALVLVARFPSTDDE